MILGWYGLAPHHRHELYVCVWICMFQYHRISRMCFLYHILSLIVHTFRENREFVFINSVQFMMSASSRIRFGLQIVFVCFYITPSHYHHCANFIWRHCTYKMPVRYNLSIVWVRLSILSQLSIIQYVGLCVFSLPISFVMIEIIYLRCLIITIKSEVWTINHCLGLENETMVCAVCLSIFSCIAVTSHRVLWRLKSLARRFFFLNSLVTLTGMKYKTPHSFPFCVEIAPFCRICVLLPGPRDPTSIIHRGYPAKRALSAMRHSM